MRPSAQRNPRSNRSDLLSPAPISSVPGQGYGVAGAQQAAQRAVPMAGGATSLPGPATAPPAGNGAQAGPGNDLMAMLQAHVQSRGPIPDVTRPTERPNEPITAGMPMGPGMGPEGLQGIGAATRGAAVEQGTMQSLLGAMAQGPGATSAIKDLAARAGAGAL